MFSSKEIDKVQLLEQHNFNLIFLTLSYVNFKYTMID